MLHRGKKVCIRTAWRGHGLEGLDELLLLPLVGQARVEVRRCQAEQALVLVRCGGGGRRWRTWGSCWLAMLEVGEHCLQPWVWRGSEEEAGQTPWVCKK